MNRRRKEGKERKTKTKKYRYQGLLADSLGRKKIETPPVGQVRAVRGYWEADELPVFAS